jgi:hypothetical protein
VLGEVSIDMASVDSGSQARDDYLRFPGLRCRTSPTATLRAGPPTGKTLAGSRSDPATRPVMASGSCRGPSPVVGQRLWELAAGADLKLAEHRAQVPIDSTGADEELGADLQI